MKQFIFYNSFDVFYYLFIYIRDHNPLNIKLINYSFYYNKSLALICIKNTNICHLLIGFALILVIIYVFYFFKKKLNKALEIKNNQLEETIFY